MYCIHCGNEIPDDSKFCIICGASLANAETDRGEETVLLSEEELGDYGEEWTAPPPEKKGKKVLAILLIGLSVALLVATMLFFLLKPFSGEEGDQEKKSERQTVSIEDVQILFSDLDWDSGRVTEGTPEVDAILLVENNADSPITGIRFSVRDRSGNEVANARDGGQTFIAEGYLAANNTGVMVARMRVAQEKLQVDSNSYTISEILVNDSIPEDYQVPTGRITDNYGPESDFYDIVVDNPNASKVNRSSIVVAVQQKGDKYRFTDADATGRLTADIGVGEMGFTQEKAFIDPNLYGNSELGKYTVYVLDTEYYQNDRSGNE